MKIQFRVEAVPVAQPRQRNRVVHTASGPVAANYTDSRHPVRDFKHAVKRSAVEAYDGPPLDSPLRLSVLFVLPRPASKVWKRRAMLREPVAKKPDLDNLLKAVLDALNETLWRDDRQIAEVLAAKVLASGSERPHVEICVLDFESDYADILGEL